MTCFPHIPRRKGTSQTVLGAHLKSPVTAALFPGSVAASTHSTSIFPCLPSVWKETGFLLSIHDFAQSVSMTEDVNTWGRWEGVRWLRRNRQSAPEQREAGPDTHPFNSGLLTDFHSFFEKVARIGLLAATNQALHTPASYHPNLLEGSASSCIHFF